MNKSQFTDGLYVSDKESQSRVIEVSGGGTRWRSCTVALGMATPSYPEFEDVSLLSDEVDFQRCDLILQS